MTNNVQFDRPGRVLERRFDLRALQVYTHSFLLSLPDGMETPSAARPARCKPCNLPDACPVAGGCFLPSCTSSIILLYYSGYKKCKGRFVELTPGSMLMILGLSPSTLAHVLRTIGNEGAHTSQRAAAARRGRQRKRGGVTWMMIYWRWVCV